MDTFQRYCLSYKYQGLELQNPGNDSLTAAIACMQQRGSFPKGFTFWLILIL
jgi:hypothetical protein